MLVKDCIADYESILTDNDCDGPAEEMVIVGHSIYRHLRQQQAEWKESIDRGEYEYFDSQAQAWESRFLRWADASCKWVQRVEAIDESCRTKETCIDVATLQQDIQEVEDAFSVPREELKEWIEEVRQYVVKNGCFPGSESLHGSADSV